MSIVLIDVALIGSGTVAALTYGKIARTWYGMFKQHDPHTIGTTHYGWIARKNRNYFVYVDVFSKRCIGNGMNDMHVGLPSIKATVVDDFCIPHVPLVIGFGIENGGSPGRNVFPVGIYTTIASIVLRNWFDIEDVAVGAGPG